MKRKNLKVVILKSPEEVAEKASEFIEKELRNKPNAVLGLSSGATMIQLYKNLARLCRQKNISFSQAKVFQIDEYVGLSKKNKNSFAYFLQRNLLRKINIKKENLNFLNGTAQKFSDECRNYEKRIRSAGYFDLLILGIGVNAHIAFNEPGSSKKTKTRVVKLSNETLKVNSKYFSSQNKIPEMALTIGISTILNSKKIILLACGKEKSAAIKKSLEKKISTNAPASFLRTHKDATFILDKKAYGK